ncbi:hypothetical protein DNTS_020297 [Danionella cerebrum]|uniref:Kinesin-like protein n=1 Tax=Danionella cerebrum TaxID=2873325 RepID=A0A553RD49_9TELE|nr:hypothetical protein DNTS_020297 [Danionella translucida]
MMCSRDSTVKVFIRFRPTDKFAHEFIECLPDQQGEMNRIIGEHALNKQSSRSHCIFTIHIESRSHTLSDAKYITSKLNLVDLAGSERLSKTGSEGQVQTEAMYINKSLSFLEQVILALADRHREHQLSTLRFASRMKCVQTKPSVNEHIDPVVQKLEKEIKFLKENLSRFNTLTSQVTNEMLSGTEVAEVRSQVQRYLSGSLDEIPIVSVPQIQEVFEQFKKVLLEQQEKFQERLSSKSIRDETAMNTAPSAIEGSVGEVEGNGYGLGLAKSSQRHLQPKAKGRKEKQTSRKEGPSCLSAENPSSHNEQPQNTNAPNTLAQESLLQAPEEELTRNHEINRILKENKSVLYERTTQLRRLSTLINDTKRNIDRIASELRQYREQRQSRGEFVSPEAEPVLEEEELYLVMQLKDLKSRYRRAYDDMTSTKAEVSYCQHLVNQCRTRLLTEFESWYNESFLLPTEVLSVLKDGVLRPGHIGVDKALSLMEDDPRGLHQPDAETTSAASFYNAYKRTLQRRGSRAVSQSPESAKGSRTRIKVSPLLSDEVNTH